MQQKMADLETSLIKTDAVAEDLKSVLISKDVIQEADLKAVEVLSQR
jgi:hypothetical protein